MSAHRYVVTGAPSSGKTTLLNALAKQGHHVMPEVARQYIDEELAKGRTLSDIRSDERAFQTQVLERKHQVEAALPKDRHVFLDRGMHDSAAYLEAIGETVTPAEARLIATSRYHTVFLLELGTFQSDYARIEDADTALKLEQLLAKVYLDAGMKVVRVPWKPLDQRVSRILGHLSISARPTVR